MKINYKHHMQITFKCVEGKIHHPHSFSKVEKYFKEYLQFETISNFKCYTTNYEDLSLLYQVPITINK